MTSALYEDEELTASFTVHKAAAPSIEWPTAQGITYGQTVSEAELSATADSHGTFAWTAPDAILGAGAQTAVLAYTPNDTANYDCTGVTLTKEIAITVSAKLMEADKGFSIAEIPDQVYTGKEIEPEITVKDGDKALTAGTDYDVEYADNIAVGTATVTVIGKGNYTGEMQVTFQIVKAADPAIQWTR